MGRNQSQKAENSKNPNASSPPMDHNSSPAREQNWMDNEFDELREAGFSRSHIRVTLMQDLGSHGLGKLPHCGYAGYSFPSGYFHVSEWTSSLLIPSSGIYVLFTVRLATLAKTAALKFVVLFCPGVSGLASQSLFQSAGWTALTSQSAKPHPKGDSVPFTPHQEPPSRGAGKKAAPAERVTLATRGAPPLGMSWSMGSKNPSLYGWVNSDATEKYNC
ncbi:LINE-1 retrotransposable element ORF1 protein [Plecturocebus cupreus]